MSERYGTVEIMVIIIIINIRSSSIVEQYSIRKSFIKWKNKYNASTGYPTILMCSATTKTTTP